MEDKTDQITIYTDGGCDMNPGGTGGWAYKLIDGDRITEKSGRAENTTNNRMELTAAIRALESLEEPATVELITDSQYLARGMTEWMAGWIRRNWALKDGSPVKNLDLWKKLYDQNRKHKITWTWVRGHADDPHNRRVDQMVQKAMKGEVVAGKSEVQTSVSAIPEVKLLKSRGKPTAVAITLKSHGAAVVDAPATLKVEATHLQKLIEDLITALRKIEES